MIFQSMDLNYAQIMNMSFLSFPKHSHKSQSLWEMRQVQAFAMTNDEKEEDKEDEKEEKKQVEPGQSAAQWRSEGSISRNLEEGGGEDDAHRGANFCTVLFPSTLFFACSHICCL